MEKIPFVLFLLAALSISLYVGCDEKPLRGYDCSFGRVDGKVTASSFKLLIEGIVPSYKSLDRDVVRYINDTMELVVVNNNISCYRDRNGHLYYDCFYIRFIR